MSNQTMSFRDNIRSLFSFPNPVNEVAARLVAGMVFILSVAIVVTGEPWVLAVLVYGFAARVTTGPKLSPMGLVATRLIAPFLGEPNLVPGPPKRFAQSVGLLLSITALLAYTIGDSVLLMRILVTVLTVFSFLEAFLGFCAGCFVFNYLMRWGLIPRSVCEQCVVRAPEIE